jgi:hypothetical protein
MPPRGLATHGDRTLLGTAPSSGDTPRQCPPRLVPSRILCLTPGALPPRPFPRMLASLGPGPLRLLFLKLCPPAVCQRRNVKLIKLLLLLLLLLKGQIEVMQNSIDLCFSLRWSRNGSALLNNKTGISERLYPSRTFGLLLQHHKTYCNFSQY